MSRYELMTDGLLSIADYRKSGNVISITHVEVPHELRGRGVAAQLMAAIVQDARAQNLTINPICSYAASYLKRHEVS
jgi:predicted GNAT family acetyltransferase